MRQVTLRGIPDDVEAAAREEARNKGISLNKALVSLLRRGADQQAQATRRRRPKAKSEFSVFVGLWDDAQGDAFDEALAEQRQIDDELWS
ncbi:hypothetical protein [Geoalkalibacter sp.]|jgi:hypothetical protein|uniref:hypothetical protein n=1 Tax=Geoalkalibacter sp. TaxID=3041440 RepID=UPI00272E73A2|nr:hypothetical protein [Geoalkalibacter sp.]